MPSDKYSTILRPSYRQNGISCTDETTSVYWISGCTNPGAKQANSNQQLPCWFDFDLCASKISSRNICRVAPWKQVFSIKPGKSPMRWILRCWWVRPLDCLYNDCVVNGLCCLPSKEKLEGWFNTFTKMSSYQHRNSQCRYKMVLRSSCHHNGFLCTGAISLYWIRHAPELRSTTICEGNSPVSYTLSWTALDVCALLCFSM